MSIKRKRRNSITQNIRMAAQQQLDTPIDESNFSKKDHEVKEYFEKHNLFEKLERFIALQKNQ